MNEFSFEKMHGAGNDYIFINGYNLTFDWPKLSIAISDRHFGIGSDGLIVAMPSQTADIKMQMFNADGSEGRMCGNGIRCLVAFAIKNNLINKDKKQIAVETLSGIKRVEPIWENNMIVGAKVAMGFPQFSPQSIPVLLENKTDITNYPLHINGNILNISCVSIGNPHCVVFTNQNSHKINVSTYGPLVENHNIFPEKVNFEVATIESRDYIEVGVWERGSGITLACGTGACAVTAIGIKQKLLDTQVTVRLPGGELKVSWTGRGEDEMILEGPVETICTGTYNFG